MRFENDERYMRRALDLAANGLGHARPNPMVGAVLVKDGRIIGEGWHEQFGGPHAEVNAFSSCTEDPEGATLYVTLEPCAHYGKTPPCCELVIKKKVARVVCAMVDPNPLVAGKGLQQIREAGIAVTTGVLEQKVRRFNEVFIKYITEKRPFVLYKAAMSFDGKTACSTGESQWISTKASREQSHILRGSFAAIMVGAGTVTMDNPSLTARFEGFHDPIRIIVDGSLSVPLDANVFTLPGRVILVTTSGTDEAKRQALQDKGAEIILSDGEKPGEVDLAALMVGLALKGIDSVLLEGGATLAAAAFKADIVDKIRIYMGPMIIGGKDAPGLIGGIGASHLSEAVVLKDIHTEMSGADLVVEAYVDRRAVRPISVEEMKHDEVPKDGTEKTYRVDGSTQIMHPTDEEVS
ncbi:MAG: bifunctional diaminohydroxyphosphoribosylaminopyrimidine deaminase/5-amino-6-(5-phosphoribosylamino)uracil reductase RibD [Dialister sp.]|nr:bifunctional diaminohydroxyphosphoribosylaminopyrimidine deaminase/5-amino-6-(5-phosphoribosylamino)uracil reductase RibD [Dialister sp.]